MKRLIGIAVAAAVIVSVAAGSGPAAVYAKPAATAQSKAGKAADELKARKLLYEKISLMTGVSWQRLAAIDQYERSMSKAKPKSRPQLGHNVGVFIDQEAWVGPLNPDAGDKTPLSIKWFNGVGRDGDGDGIAERTNDTDLLYSIASKITQYGTSDDDFAIGLWEYYHNGRAVKRIRQFADIYAAYGKLDLFEHAFPIPIGDYYAYRSTWGTGRSWGGRRIHEGTDIFAPQGTPVRSTCYGIIEVKGWNPYGGWRLGIRDLNNYYHYYAHLQGYEKSIKIGDIVKPGQPVGWVGSSGYGKPGTQGKFPPHLHYGVYRDRGLVEWSFDPYPMLRSWEAAEYRRLKSKK